MSASQKLVESYVRLSLERNRNSASLRELMTDGFSYQSPLATCRGFEDYLHDDWGSALRPVGVDIQSVIGNEREACAIYDVETSDPHADRVVVMDWLTFENGKISSVRSVFDSEGPFQRDSYLSALLEGRTILPS